MSGFKSERYANSGVITINGDIERVFPLFTAEGEKLWIDYWDYETVFAEKGTTHKGMIFTTVSSYSDDETMYWIVSKFDEENHEAEYTVVSPAYFVVVVNIKCTEAGDKTEAEVTYTLTGLSEQGNEAAKARTDDTAYSKTMSEWQMWLNEYFEKNPLT